METTTGYTLNKEKKTINGTSGSTVTSRLESKFTTILSTNNNIFIHILDVIPTIKNGDVRIQVEEFIKNLHEILSLREEYKLSLVKLPTARLFPMDDDSVLFEWNYAHFKIGFSFEVDRNESTYYFVTDDTFDNWSVYNNIPWERLGDLLRYAVNFVYVNM